MKSRPLAILLIAIIAFHALAGGAGGVAVICFGGGHEHGPAETEHCEVTCSHSTSWPLPVPAEDRDHDCGCTDFKFSTAELVATPRSDLGSSLALAVVPIPAWGIVVTESGLGRRGPPMPPPWFDPGSSQRLAMVASVRLTL